MMAFGKKKQAETRNTAETREKSQKKRSRHPILKAVFTLLFLAVLGMMGFVGFITMRKQYTVIYQGYQARQGSITDTLEYTARLQLVRSETYTADAETTVRSVMVTEGEQVKEGQRLLRLSNGQTVTAGFSGRVNSIPVKADDVVTQGTELLQLADFSRMRIAFTISEYDVPKVKVGTECTVQITASGEEMKASVSSMDYSSVSRGAIAYYTAWLELDNVEAGLYPGMQVKVKVPRTLAENTVILSSEALSFDDDNRAFVYLQQEDGSMLEQPVTLGVRNDDNVQIIDGIAANAAVYVKKEPEAITANSLISGLMGSFTGNMSGSTGSSTSRRPGGYSGGDVPMDREYRREGNTGNGRQ